MNISIKTTGAIVLTGELRSFVEEKLAKVEKLLDAGDKTALVEVELESVTRSRTGDSFRAEINCAFTGGFARAEATRDTLHAAVDEAILETKREIRRARTKRRDLLRRGAARAKEFFNRFKG